MTAILLRRLPAALATALSLVAGWLAFPETLGGRTGYLQVSGTSMEPGLRSGDLAIIRRRDAYEPGDVVAFRIPRGEVGEGSVVIHRIAGGSPEQGFRTRGDNRDADDPWRPREEDVVGALLFHVPGVARWMGAVRDPLPLAALAGGLTLVLWRSGRAGKTAT